MLRAFVLCSVVLVAAGASIDPRCSRYNQGMEAQVLPYLGDCRKFVICDMGGNGQVLRCPTDLYFDVASHACSFDSGSCTHGELEDDTNDVVPPVPIKPQPQIPVEPQPLPVQPLPRPVQPQPMVPVIPLPVQPQPVPVVPEAVLPVMPQEGVNPPFVTAPTTVAPHAEQQQEGVEGIHQQNLCRDQSAGKLYPVADDCGLYVVCMGDNRAIVQRCPKGLLYDSKQQRCEFAEASFCPTPRMDGNVELDVNGVDMSLRSEEDSSETLDALSYAVPVIPVEEIMQHSMEVDLMHQQQPILIVPEPEPEPEAAVEYSMRIVDNHPRCLARVNQLETVELPHETDCSKYLVCVGRAAIEKQCPNGQHWSTRNNWCDFPSAAGCKL